MPFGCSYCSGEMKNTCHPCSSHFVEEERFKLNTKGILGEGKEAEKSSQQDTKEVAGSWRKMQQPSGQLSFVPVQCTLYSIGEVDTWGAGRKRMQLEANCQLLHTQRQFSIKKNGFFRALPRLGEGRPLPEFLALSQEVHFWSKIGVYFFQKANKMNFKLFFLCVPARNISWPD